MKNLAALALGALVSLGCSGVDDPWQTPAPVANPSLTLYVSNQSFDIDPVDITIYIDDELAVAGDFLVEGQHSWHQFTFKLPPGDHSLSAITRAGDTTLVEFVDIDAAKHGVLNFWFYPDDGRGAEPTPRQFSFDVYDQPPLFD